MGYPRINPFFRARFVSFLGANGPEKISVAVGSIEIIMTPAPKLRSQTKSAHSNRRRTQL